MAILALLLLNRFARYSSTHTALPNLVLVYN